MICIYHDLILAIIADHISHGFQFRSVCLKVRADLELERGITLLDRLKQNFLHSVTGESHPAWRGRIRRDSNIIKRLGQSSLLALLGLVQHLDSFFWSNHIRNISKINTSNNLLWRHLANDLPDWLLKNLAPKIPNSVEYTCYCQMRHRFLRPNPTILRIRNHIPKCLAHIASQFVEGLSDHSFRENLQGHAEVRETSPISIQSGENWWFPRGFAEAIASGASDYIMPDLMKVGGITGWLRVAGQAEAASIPMSSHLFAEASAHMLAVTPTAHWIEYLDLARAIVAEPVQIVDGTITARGAGLGLRWDEAAVAKYLV